MTSISRADLKCGKWYALYNRVISNPKVEIFKYIGGVWGTALWSVQRNTYSECITYYGVESTIVDGEVFDLTDDEIMSQMVMESI